MGKEKLLTEMSKTELLEFSIIKAASLSEMLITAKENIKTTEVTEAEYSRRAMIASELAGAICLLFKSNQQ